MEIQYYSHEDDKYYGFTSDNISDILDKVKRYDFNSRFEFSIGKTNSALQIIKVGVNYHVALIEFNEESQERTGVRVESLDVINKYIDEYLTELGHVVTKKSIENYRIERKEDDRNKFDNWKKDYEVRREKEKFHFLKPLFITLGLAFLVGVSIHYWRTDEFKFILRETENTVATIVETSMLQAGSRYYYQKIVFEYEVNNKRFIGEEIIGIKVGKKKVGDLVKLKIATKSPEINKVIAYPKKKKSKSFFD